MTDQTPAKPRTARKPRSRTAVDKAGAAFKETLKAELAQRPYVLESSIIEDDLRRAASNASAEIDAIDADLLAIQERANNDINAIVARRDAEITSRNHRRNDLSRIVAIATRGLTEPVEPIYDETTPATSVTLALQIEAQRQQEDDQ